MSRRATAPPGEAPHQVGRGAGAHGGVEAQAAEGGADEDDVEQTAAGRAARAEGGPRREPPLFRHLPVHPSIPFLSSTLALRGPTLRPRLALARVLQLGSATCVMKDTELEATCVMKDTELEKLKNCLQFLCALSLRGLTLRVLQLDGATSGSTFVPCFPTRTPSLLSSAQPTRVHSTSSLQKETD